MIRKLLLLAIIVWSRPDGGVSYTYVPVGSAEAEAARLQAVGAIPPDWEAVAFNITLPGKGRRNSWRWQNGQIRDEGPPIVIGPPAR